MTRQTKLLFEGSEWNPDILQRMYDAIEEVARNDLGLDTYPNQIEIVSAEQMLDAHASIGLPRMYRHWSFGKHFMREDARYRKGVAGLAYELVINSIPCISYNMEQNTAAMMALVMAHAAFGHNHFFKNNYLFRARTDAEGVLDYLGFARGFVKKCEERYGEREVEKTLDAAHALMNYGVFRNERPHSLTKQESEKRAQRVRAFNEGSFDPVSMSTIPGELERYWKSFGADPALAERVRRGMQLPEDNLLYFIEKYSPTLEEWQREIIRIVRYLAEYFYPQKQTKVMNEGCATFVHFYIMNVLHKKSLISDGAMTEIIHVHSNVVFQPDYDDPRYRGINPYNLGWNMMRDIARISTGREGWTVDPFESGSKACDRLQLAEDREWFPEFAGCGDWREVLKDAWANFRDESFVLQHLSPRLMRNMRMFLILNNIKKPHLKVREIANKVGYRRVRHALARDFDIKVFEPPIEVTDVDFFGDRELHLQHRAVDGAPLHVEEQKMTLAYIKYLWGYPTRIESVNSRNGTSMSLVTSEDESSEDTE